MTMAAEVPTAMVAQMRNAPMWGYLEAVAHTLPYDGADMGDNMSGKPLQAGKWATTTMPTLVIDGGASPTWMHNGAQAATDVLPNAQRRTLEGQTHNVDPAVLAPVLVGFFAG